MSPTLVLCTAKTVRRRSEKTQCPRRKETVPWQTVYVRVRAMAKAQLGRMSKKIGPNFCLMSELGPSLRTRMLPAQFTKLKGFNFE